jgi:quercetin dioxygenase-like cupin family protein
MERHDLDDLKRGIDASGRLYQEFIRSHDLSAGLYVIQAGGVDPQEPHTEDEIYHVVRGRAMLSVGDETSAVAPGCVVFVPAGVAHRFHDVTDELVVLVVFGPAEYTHRAGAHEDAGDPPRG